MKLIRDKLAEKIIAEEGEGKVKEASSLGVHYLIMAKVIEEAQEIAESTNKKEMTEEIGDLFEVVEELMEREGISMAQVDEARQKKAEKRGVFKKNYILVEEK